MTTNDYDSNDYPTALLGLLRECRNQAAVYQPQTAKTTKTSMSNSLSEDGGGDTDGDTDVEEEEDEAKTPPPPSATADDEDDDAAEAAVGGLSDEDKQYMLMVWECRMGLIASEGLKYAKPVTSSSSSSGMAFNGVLFTEYEGHLAYLLTEAPWTEAREAAVKGIGRLALLDERSANK